MKFALSELTARKVQELIRDQNLVKPAPFVQGHPSVEFLRYDGDGTAYVNVNDGTGWEELDAPCLLVNTEDTPLVVDKLYLARGYGEIDGHPLYVTTFCCDNCEPGVTACAQCDCASRSFSFDINNAEVSAFNGHYTVTYLSGCTWGGSNGSVLAELTYKTLSGINCWVLTLDDGTDQLVFTVGCECTPGSGATQVCCGLDETATFTVSFDNCDCLANVTYTMTYSHTAGGIIYYTSGVNDFCTSGTWQFYIYCFQDNWYCLPSYSCDTSQQDSVLADSAVCDPFEVQFTLTFPSCADCNGGTVIVNQPPTCPTSVCITVADMPDAGCTDCANLIGDTTLPGSCNNFIGTYILEVDLCTFSGAYRWYCVIQYNSDYTDGEVSLSLQRATFDPDTNVITGWETIASWSSTSGTFPRTLAEDACSNAECATCSVPSIDLALGACSGGGGSPADCDCVPPNTLYAEIIDYTTGNCSTCLNQTITLTRTGYVWSGHGVWCGQNVYLDIRCNNSTGLWQMRLNDPNYVDPYGTVICDPFNGVWLISVWPACTAFIQVTE